MGVQENQNCTTITLRMKDGRRRWSNPGANNMAKLLTSRENKELSDIIDKYTDGMILAEPVQDFRVGFCMPVRFASDRRIYQGGAKRNRRMQKLPKIELVLLYCLYLPVKMGELIRTKVQGINSEEELNGELPISS